MAPSEWTCSVRAVRDIPVAFYSAPGINTRCRVAYRHPIAGMPFLLALSVSYFKQTLWCCGQLWPYVGMGSFGTCLHRDCNTDPQIGRHHRIIWTDCNADPAVERRGSTQLRETLRPDGIITSHPHPMLLEPGWLLIMAWRDREGWLNFVFLGDGRGDGTYGNLVCESIHHPRYGRHESRSGVSQHRYEVFPTQSGKLYPWFLISARILHIVLIFIPHLSLSHPHLNHHRRTHS